jgi:hypothetical protein
MSLIAVTSAGDAPGATTSAFAFTLTWPEQVLLAECSPAGGRLLRGYFQCTTPPDRGLWDLGVSAVRDPDAAAEALWEQVLALNEEQERFLLPGLNDPFVAVQLTSTAWEALASTFAGLPFTVLADVGPIVPELPFPLLRSADLVLVVMRPTLAQVAAARVRLERLRQALGRGVPVGLCLIGDHPYTTGEVRAQLGDFAVVVRLPWDERAARVLSDGGGSQRVRRRIESSELLRQASVAGQVVHRFAAEQRRALRQGDPVPVPDAVAGGGS